jgi:polygalacturonase
MLHLLLLLIFASCQNASVSDESKAVAPDPWAKMNEILAAIQPPVFPDKTFDITAYGGKTGGKTDCLSAIKKAIEECNAAGGGKVLLPAGEYLVNGPIHLKSNVNLHIAEGATVKFSTNPKHYLPVVMTRWEAAECYNYSPLIYAYQQENIAITGTGTLDGQADSNNWWNWVDKEEYGWKPGMPSQAGDHSRPKLVDWNTREVVGLTAHSVQPSQAGSAGTHRLPHRGLHYGRQTRHAGGKPGARLGAAFASVF